MPATRVRARGAAPTVTAWPGRSRRAVATDSGSHTPSAAAVPGAVASRRTWPAKPSLAASCTGATLSTGAPPWGSPDPSAGATWTGGPSTVLTGSPSRGTRPATTPSTCLDRAASSFGPIGENMTTDSAGTPPIWPRSCCRAASPAAGRNSRVETVTAASTRAAPATASATPGKWISRNGVFSSIPPVGRLYRDQTSRSRTRSATSSRAPRTGHAGRAARAALAASTSAWAARRASAMAGEARSRSRASATDRSSWSPSRTAASRAAPAAAEQVQHRQGPDPGSQVAAWRLARHGGLGGDVEQVVAELEGAADPFAVLGERLDHVRRRAGQAPAEPAGGGDERAGLVGEHGQVVLDRVLAGGGAAHLADLALDEPGDGPGEHAGRLGAEPGRHLGGAGEQVVAGEHGHLVVVAGVGRAGAAAHLRLVHDVVVVEARQVRQLDGDRGADQPRVARIAGVAGQQHQRGPKALAAGGDQVAGGLLHERVGGDHRVPQGLLDLDEARPDPRLDLGQAGVRRRVGVGGAHYPRRSEEHTSELQSHHDIVCR